MDLRWLDDVLVLLEEGNLTSAAARRNVTQPAFSRRIRAFEDWLGAPLLDRQANRIEIGQALFANEADIRALVARIGEMRTNLAEFDQSKSTIAIAAQHAPFVSSFPDMAARAKAALPKHSFRLRAANLEDCVTTFLRGDAAMLLCYEAETARPLDFGASVVRGDWGVDHLVPVVGGTLRYAVTSNGNLPLSTPSVAYPPDSYFGKVLNRSERVFGTPEYSRNPVGVTAFSSGAKELVLSGLGVGWLPFSMVHREVTSGELVSLAHQFGQEPLRIAIFADAQNDVAMELLGLWSQVSVARDLGIDSGVT